jgi:predicted Zn-dependent protease
MLVGMRSAWRLVQRFVALGALTCGLSGAPLALAHGALHDRIAQISKRIAERPNDASLYLRRAELYGEHGTLRAAQADLDRARSLEPTLSEVDLVRARVLLQGNQPEPALQAVDAYLARDALLPDAHRVRAEILFRLERFAPAEAEYTAYLATAEAVQPDDYLRHAEAIASQGHPHLARAVAALDEGIRRLGAVESLEERAIELSRRRGDTDDTLRRLDGVMARAKHKERWLALRGDVLADAKRLAEARAAYEGSLKAISERHGARRQTTALLALRKDVEAKLARLSAPRR